MSRRPKASPARPALRTLSTISSIFRFRRLLWKGSTKAKLDPISKNYPSHHVFISHQVSFKLVRERKTPSSWSSFAPNGLYSSLESQMKLKKKAYQRLLYIISVLISRNLTLNISQPLNLIPFSSLPFQTFSNHPSPSFPHLSPFHSHFQIKFPLLFLYPCGEKRSRNPNPKPQPLNQSSLLSLSPSNLALLSRPIYFCDEEG